MTATLPRDRCPKCSGLLAVTPREYSADDDHAPDMYAAINEATEATIATRGTVTAETAEPIRLEVVLRKADGR